MSALARPLKWPPIFPLDKNLVLWLPLDDRSGSKALDRSGKQNHGTLEGPTWVAGRRGSALSFDGISNFVRVLHNPSLNFTTESFSLASWFKVNSLNKYQYLVMKGGWKGSGYDFFVYDTNRISFRTFQSGELQITQSNIIEKDKWYHAVAVRNGSIGCIYVNGVNDTYSTESHLNPTSNVFNMQIGIEHGETAFSFDGIVGGVRIYNRALNAAEVKRLCESELMLVRH